MGASGGGSPGPWKMYTSSTRFLRVPSPDWAAVKHGSKMEFRTAGRVATSGPDRIECPTPVVAYTVRPHGQHESQLMVLIATWREPLGAISAESLTMEGFADVEHFRRYWMSRTHRRFRPLTSVQVYRLRPFIYEDNEDLEHMGELLMRRLYREHLK